MDTKRISDSEIEILYKVADEYHSSQIIEHECPRCGGKLQYMGNMSAYCIFCENKCGIIFNVRGI